MSESHEHVEHESWLENPRLSLEDLTPGQRYTSLLAIAAVAGFIAFGMPSTTIAANGIAIPTEIVAAGLAEDPGPTPATTAIPGAPTVPAPAVAFESTPTETSVTTFDTTSTTPDTTPPPPPPSTTTTTTTAPSPITLPSLPLATP